MFDYFSSFITLKFWCECYEFPVDSLSLSLSLSPPLSLSLSVIFLDVDESIPVYKGMKWKEGEFFSPCMLGVNKRGNIFFFG